jgi:hypothetical protein
VRIDCSGQSSCDGLVQCNTNRCEVHCSTSACSSMVQCNASQKVGDCPG